MNTLPFDPTDIWTSTVHGVRVQSAVSAAGAPRSAPPLIPPFGSGRLVTHELTLQYAPLAEANVSPHGELFARQSWSGQLEYEFYRAETELFFNFPNFCSGVASLERRTLTLFAASPADAALVLPNTILSALLGPAGDLVLHASAVRWDGATIAFCGVSGSGKSTLAAACTLAGAVLVTDDALRVRLNDAAPAECYPGVGELRLRQLRPWPLPPEQLHPLVDERTGFRPSEIVHEQTPLRGLVFPVIGDVHTAPRIDLLRGERAMRRLLSASRIAWTPNVAAPVLRKLAALAERVPVCELHVSSSYLDCPANHLPLLASVSLQLQERVSQ